MLIVVEALYHGRCFVELMTNIDLFTSDRKVEQKSYYSTRGTLQQMRIS